MKKILIITTMIVLIGLLVGCSQSPEDLENSVAKTLSVMDTQTAVINQGESPEDISPGKPSVNSFEIVNNIQSYTGSKEILFQKVLKNASGEVLSNLFTIDLSSKALTQITNNPFGVQYAGISLSANGEKIVYSLCDLDLESEPCELYEMDSNGTNIKKLSVYPEDENDNKSSELITEIHPNYVNDSTILFVSTRDDLKNYPYSKASVYSMNLGTQEITESFRTTYTSIYPSISPDGNKIVFTGHDENDWEIFLSDLSKNGAVTQITNDDSSDRFASWSPDGKWLVFHSDRDGNFELYKMKMDGSELTRITSNEVNDYTASWSPNGQWITYISEIDGYANLFIMNILSNETIQLTFTEDEISFPQWVPLH